MDRREFLKGIALGAGCLALGGCSVEQTIAAASSSRANILFIFADDQCFETIRALGSDEVYTPNLDRLVKRGVTFTHAYNQGGWHGAICVASRVMLNTGRFLWNANNLDNHAEFEAGRFWGPEMKRAGYETYFSGKWHIDVEANKAFDHVEHIRPGMPNQTDEGYDRPKTYGEPNLEWSPWDKSKDGYWKWGKHWSEVLGDDAEAFLERAGKSDKPFFMYLAFNAPHDPRQSPKEYVDKYPWQDVKVPENFLPNYPYDSEIGCDPKKLRDERLAPSPRTEFSVKVNRQEYYAIITHMDHQVGRILDALERSGKADNTYIMFTADHGLSVGHHGLIGKQNMYDHSMRVPLIICGPDVPKDRRIDAGVYLQDIMPTSLEIAGVKKRSYVQFKSLLPLIRGEEKESYNAIYGAYMNLQRMVVQDDFKLILYPEISKTRLYDLSNDPYEMNDLADDPAYKSKIGKLFRKLIELQKETGDMFDLTKTFKL